MRKLTGYFANSCATCTHALVSNIYLTEGRVRRLSLPLPSTISCFRFFLASCFDYLTFPFVFPTTLCLWVSFSQPLRQRARVRKFDFSTPWGTRPGEVIVIVVVRFFVRFSFKKKNSKEIIVRFYFFKNKNSKEMVVRFLFF